MYETDVPFLALLNDREPSKGATLGGYFEGLNSVYLVNPTGAEIRATVSTSGFFSDDELGVMVAEGKPPKQWTLAPRSFVCIENPSDDELDEVVCSWSILIESGGELVRRPFTAASAAMTRTSARKFQSSESRDY